MSGAQTLQDDTHSCSYMTFNAVCNRAVCECKRSAKFQR